MTATGRKKLDELYHPVTDRSEFYAMQDLAKPPVLFTPSEDIEKLSGMDLQSFYAHEGDAINGDVKGTSPFLLHSSQKPTTPTLKFHNHFPPDVPTWVKYRTCAAIHSFSFRHISQRFGFNWIGFAFWMTMLIVTAFAVCFCFNLISVRRKRITFLITQWFKV